MSKPDHTTNIALATDAPASDVALVPLTPDSVVKVGDHAIDGTSAIKAATKAWQGILAQRLRAEARVEAKKAARGQGRSAEVAREFLDMTGGR